MGYQHNDSLAENPDRQVMSAGFRLADRELLTDMIGGELVCAFDQDFTVLYCGDGFRKLTGYSSKDLETLFQNKYIRTLYPDDRKKAVTDMKHQLKETGQYETEYRIKRSDGKILWVMDKGVLIQPEERTAPRLAHVIIDITLQKEYEEALRISDKRYEILLDFSDLTIFDYNIETDQIIHNWVDVELYHLPRVMDNAVDAFLSSGVITPASEANFREIYAQIRAGAPAAQAIIHATDANGNETVVELRLASIFDSDGKPLRAIGLKRDITETLQLQREKEYGNTLASNRLLVYEANVTRDKIISYNKKWAEEMRITEISSFSEMTRHVCQNTIASEFIEAVEQQLSRSFIVSAFGKGQRLIVFEYRKKTESGNFLWMEQTINMIKDEISGDISVRGYVTNIDDRKEKEQRILEEKKFYTTMRSKVTIIYEVDFTRNLFLSGHRKWGAIYGIQQTDHYSDMMREIAEDVLYPEDKQIFCDTLSRENVLNAYANGVRELSCDYRRPGENKEFVWVRSMLHLLEDPKTGNVKGFNYVEDVDAEKKKELALIYKSEHDILTGFYNKSTVQERIDAFLDTEKAKREKHAFFIIDIDHFKLINDSFGHAFGDAILSQVSAKINDLFRCNDLLGRIGGDEFIAFMKNISNEKIALSKAREICRNVSEKNTGNIPLHNITLSIGIAFYSEHGKCYEELYHHSDAALYFSKENGRDQFTTYNDGMSKSASVAKEIRERGLLAEKTFEGNIGEYVFRILYESSDKETSIQSVLALISKHYNVSRAYIFETSPDGLRCDNTFEWQNRDTAPCVQRSMDFFQQNTGNYRDYFNAEGIFHVPDIEEAPLSLRQFFLSQKVKSLVQYSIVKNGGFLGFIGFDWCEYFAAITAEDLSELRNIANILSVFIMEMRANQKNLAAQKMAMSVVNGLSSYAYVCDPKTFEILFINEQTKSLVPDAKIGDLCYKVFRERDTPCEACPMQELIKANTRRCCTDLYNPYLKIWVKSTASWITWLEEKQVCLVDSVDITKYMEGREIPFA